MQIAPVDLDPIRDRIQTQQRIWKRRRKLKIPGYIELNNQSRSTQRTKIKQKPSGQYVRTKRMEHMLRT